MKITLICLSLGFISVSLKIDFHEENVCKIWGPPLLYIAGTSTLPVKTHRSLFLAPPLCPHSLTLKSRCLIQTGCRVYWRCIVYSKPENESFLKKMLFWDDTVRPHGQGLLCALSSEPQHRQRLVRSMHQTMGYSQSEMWGFPILFKPSVGKFSTASTQSSFLGSHY